MSVYLYPIHPPDSTPLASSLSNWTLYILYSTCFMIVYDKYCHDKNTQHNGVSIQYPTVMCWIIPVTIATKCYRYQSLQ